MRSAWHAVVLSHAIMFAGAVRHKQQFVPATGASSRTSPPAHQQTVRGKDSQMIMEPAEEDSSMGSDRRAVLAGLLASAVGVAASPGPADAGYVMSLGSTKAKKEDEEVDQEAFKSKDVQASIEALKATKTKLASVKSQFDTDTNMDLVPIIRKEFDVAKIRQDLNNVVTIYDEGTQLTVDKLSRNVLNDVIELVTVSRQKKSNPNRTPKKVTSVSKWFEKTNKDLTEFIEYIPS